MGGNAHLAFEAGAEVSCEKLMIVVNIVFHCWTVVS
jgi:hypothetical protein